jgi:hypothetical protein
MQERVPPRFFPALNRDSFISPDRFRVYSLILPLSHLDSCHTVIIDKRVSQVSPKGRMFAPLYSLSRLVFRLSLDFDFGRARFQSLFLTHRPTSPHMNRPSRSWLKHTYHNAPLLGAITGLSYTSIWPFPASTSVSSFHLNALLPRDNLRSPPVRLELNPYGTSLKSDFHRFLWNRVSHITMTPVSLSPNPLACGIESKWV